jgi:hypothetical protein
MNDYANNRIGRLASVRSWHREAQALRELAERSHLSDGQRHTLLREADAADRQADTWFDAAIVSSQRTTRISKSRSPQSTNVGE